MRAGLPARSRNTATAFARRMATTAIALPTSTSVPLAGSRLRTPERTVHASSPQERNVLSGCAPSRAFWPRACRYCAKQSAKQTRRQRAASCAIAKRPLALIVESNSLMQFVKPTLFFAVLDPAKEDFKDSARAALDRADALVIRGNGVSSTGEPAWMKLPAKLLREKPSVSQAEGAPLPEPLEVLVKRALEAPPGVVI